ncbi:palmitoyltransferase ZDHHC11-like isoform X3 [Crocuta crocuta]
MDLCGWSQRQAVLEARNKRAPVSNLSRVNGWSWPLHPFQALAWTMVFIFSLANFGVFIPFLPPNWNFIAYGVTGGLFLFHLVVHLTAVSIDPAEATVRLRNYAEPLPIFDRTKHAHVIQNQYCHLCQVTVNKKAKHCSYCNKCVSNFDHHCKWLNNCVGSRNYWYFFSSLVSASISLLCLITILLFIFIQFFINPAQLRTHPHYKNISDANTWLLFLPLFPVKTKTLGVLGIGLFVLLLSIFSLVMLGHLLIFHVYLMSKKLSTYEFLTQGHSQKTPKVSAGPEPLFIKVKMPQFSFEENQHSPDWLFLVCLQICELILNLPRGCYGLHVEEGHSHFPTLKNLKTIPIIVYIRAKLHLLYTK